MSTSPQRQVSLDDRLLYDRVRNGVDQLLQKIKARQEADARLKKARARQK